jgi:hypothetical protein
MEEGVGSHACPTRLAAIWANETLVSVFSAGCQIISDKLQVC